MVTTTTLAPPAGCDPGDPSACDDGNPCTRDSCGGAFLACRHFPLDDAPCADDGVFCTVDRCQAGVCTHRLSDRRCDRGECVIRACRPDDRHADHHGCILVKGKDKRDGVPCTDDGFACTDDVCMHGACMHLPVADRCVPRGLCTTAACDPGMPDHDDAGCAHGPPGFEGAECAEDADACTRDVCRAGACAHEPETDQAACAPVRDVFRQTLAVVTVAAELRDELAGRDVPIAEVALARLAAIEARLAAAAAALDGQPDGVTPLLAVRPAAVSGMSAEERARIAFTNVLRTPRQISGFLSILAQAQARAQLGHPAAKHFRRRGRVLLRGARRLRTELRALQG